MLPTMGTRVPGKYSKENKKKNKEKMSSRSTRGSRESSGEVWPRIQNSCGVRDETRDCRWPTDAGDYGVYIPQRDIDPIVPERRTNDREKSGKTEKR